MADSLQDLREVSQYDGDHSLPELQDLSDLRGLVSEDDGSNCSNGDRCPPWETMGNPSKHIWFSYELRSPKFVLLCVRLRYAQGAPRLEIWF